MREPGFYEINVLTRMHGEQNSERQISSRSVIEIQLADGNCLQLNLAHDGLTLQVMHTSPGFATDLVVMPQVSNVVHITTAESIASRRKRLQDERA